MTDFGHACLPGFGPAPSLGWALTYVSLAGTAAVAWLVAICLPAVVLIGLEFWRGHEVELRSQLRAAVALPLAACLALGLWLDVSAGGPCVLDATAACAWLGLSLTAALLVPARLAVARARRRRKPLSPAPVS